MMILSLFDSRSDYSNSVIQIEEDDYDFLSRKTMLAFEKTWLLEKFQSILWKAEFWKTSFYKVLKRHNFQKDFYLLGSEPDYLDVDYHLYKVLGNLRSKYDIACHRETAKGCITLRLSVSYVNNTFGKKLLLNSSEMVISIDKSQISLMVLPYSKMVANFPLDEYFVVENIITDFCQEWFLSPHKELINFQEYREKLDEDEKYLTDKSIQIALSSIKTIYKSFGGKDEDFSKGYLFSTVRIGDRKELILHRDFLDDPQFFISLLQKK